jgi:rod shape-determining protein MreD
MQILLFSNIQFSGFINPYCYVLFIMLLPFQFSRTLSLFLGLAMGILIDLFSGTPGVHSTATLFLAFVRPYVLDLIAQHDRYEGIPSPRISYLGLEWFVIYTLIMVLLHHLVLFYIEVFSFAHFFHTLLKVLLSSVFTFIFIILSQYFIFRK